MGGDLLAIQCVLNALDVLTHTVLNFDEHFLQPPQVSRGLGHIAEALAETQRKTILLQFGDRSIFDEEGV